MTDSTRVFNDRLIRANRIRQADELRLMTQAETIVQATARRLHDYGVGLAYRNEDSDVTA